MYITLKADDLMPWGKYMGLSLRSIYKVDSNHYKAYIYAKKDSYGISATTNRIVENDLPQREVSDISYSKSKGYRRELKINDTMGAGPFYGKTLLAVYFENESYYRYLYESKFYISKNTFEQMRDIKYPPIIEKKTSISNKDVVSKLKVQTADVKDNKPKNKNDTTKISNTKQDEFLYDLLSSAQRQMVDEIFSKLKSHDSRLQLVSRKYLIGFRYEEIEGEKNPYWFRVKRSSSPGKIEFVMRDKPDSPDKTPIELNSKNLKEIIRRIDLLFAKEGSYIESIRQQIINKHKFDDYKSAHIQNTELYPHQIAGVRLAQKYNKFAFFYDTGTGKTILSLEIIAEKQMQEGARFLIVAPKPLIKNGWLEDCRKHYPHLKIMPLSSNITKEDIVGLYNWWNEIDGIDDRLDPNVKYRTKQIDSIKLELEKRANHFIINLQQIIKPSKAQQLLEKIKVNGLIVDESTTIKNHESKSFKRIRVIAKSKDTKYVYLLSGKPAPNTTVEYYGQMSIVAPELFNMSYDKFVATYYKADNKYGKYSFKNGATKETVSKMVSEKSITVSKEQCISLPPRHFKEVPVVLEDSAMIDYAKVLHNIISYIVDLDGEKIYVRNQAFLAKMMKLREMATGFYIDDLRDTHNMSENKLCALVDLVKKIGNNQIIIWCNFVYEIECIKERLESLGYTVATAYRKTKKLDDNIQDFKNNRVQIMIANPQTLKYGVTFVNCRYAIYNSLSYSYDDYYQSRDRIYRIGQKHECVYYHLISEDTIDEEIYYCLKNKQNNVVMFERLIKSAARQKHKIESDMIDKSLEKFQNNNKIIDVDDIENECAKIIKDKHAA